MAGIVKEKVRMQVLEGHWATPQVVRCPSSLPLQLSRPAGIMSSG